MADFQFSHNRLKGGVIKEVRLNSCVEVELEDGRTLCFKPRWTAAQDKALAFVELQVMEAENKEAVKP